MQVIRGIAVSAEEYQSASMHRGMDRPAGCPNCGGSRAPVALGYYSRGVTSGGKLFCIWVRRFRCRECGKTVSVLPCFAQPYRMVENRTIEVYFRGELNPAELKWLPILEGYRSAFARWVPHLAPCCGTALPRSPPFSETLEWWHLLAEVFGDLRRATIRLVGCFRITLFGRYRCHAPNPG